MKDESCMIRGWGRKKRKTRGWLSVIYEWIGLVSLDNCREELSDGLETSGHVLEPSTELSCAINEGKRSKRKKKEFSDDL